MKKIYFLTVIFIFLFSTNTFAQRILLSQGFENGPYTSDSLPLKWAKVKVNGPGSCTTPAADWRVRDSGKAFCGTNSLPGFHTKAYNSKKSLSIPWTATLGNITDDWVFTDSVRIATGDSLKFWIQLGTWPDGQATYYMDSLQIWVTSAQTPASQITRLGTVISLPSASNVWQFKTFDLSAYANQKIYIAFRYYMNVSLDGIMVNVDSVFIGNLSGSPVGININESPVQYELVQNYPNPFNPSTTFTYSIAKAGFVKLVIYDVLGNEVDIIVNEYKNAGTYELNYNASKLSSGTYFYTLTSGEFKDTKRMSLLK